MYWHQLYRLTQQGLFTTSLHTILSGFEAIAVTIATAVQELFAVISDRVKVPAHKASLARASVFGQHAHLYTSHTRVYRKAPSTHQILTLVGNTDSSSEFALETYIYYVSMENSR